MARPLQNSSILAFGFMLLIVAGAGVAYGAGVGSAGRDVGFPTTNGRQTASAGQGEDYGLGIFSNIPFHVTVSLRAGYDDNIATTNTSQQGSAFVNGTIGLTYNFGSPRTQLSLQLGGGITDFLDRPNKSAPDYNAYLGLSLKHHFTPRLGLDVTAYAAYQAEPDFANGTGFNRRTGNYFFSDDRFTLTYLWAPRFSTATSYTLTALVYDNTGVAGVGSFENRIENMFGNQFRFLMWPTMTLVAEYRIQFTTYLDSDTDAVGNYILAGFDYSFSPRLHLSYRGGVQMRSLDTTETVIVFIPKPPFFVPETIHTSSDSTSPYFETTVTYDVGKQTSVIWTNRYGIEEPDLPGQPGRTTFRTGLNAKHSWTPRISSRLALFYSHDHYGPQAAFPSSDQDSIDAAISLRYAVTRYLAAEVGYNYTDVISDVALRGYTRNRFYGGVDFSF